MKKPVNPALLFAYRKFRQQGMGASEAKKQAERQYRKFQALKKLKEAGHNTSREALGEIKFWRLCNRVRKIMLSINPAYRISLEEAADLQTVNESYLMEEHPNYKFSDFLRAYAEIRFAQKRKRAQTPRELAKRIEQIIIKMKGKLTQIDRKNILASSVIHGRETRVYGGLDLIDYFERTRREFALHSTPRQQHALASRLYDLLRVAPHLRKFARKEVLKLKKPASKETMSKIFDRIPKFETLGKAVQHRIVQEARATELGEKIAGMAEEDILAEYDMKKRHNVFFGVTDKKPLEWLLDCLKRPGNRKFLGQKAIEWFRRKKK